MPTKSEINIDEINTICIWLDFFLIAVHINYEQGKCPRFCRVLYNIIKNWHVTYISWFIN